MTKYVETIIRITNIVDMGEQGVTPGWIVLEFEELEKGVGFFNQKQTLHIKKEKFNIPYEGKISKLNGKILRLVLQD